MNYYVYRTDKSEGADSLVRALGAKRLKNDTRVELKSGDVVVNWGAVLAYPVPRGVRVLNNTNLLDKFEQVKIMTKAKVETVTAVKTLEAWIHRDLEHYDGNDLKRGLGLGGFWVKREDIVKEFRVHSFDGKSIRAGVKEPAGPDAHPWIRTYTHGWRINCTGFRSSPQMREIAHAAVKALKLEFGAVDIGQRADGSLLVIEVNRSPGAETDSQPFEAYADAVREWAGE
jgi:hypothetical protein